MIRCKNCQSEKIIKNGIVRSIQRYKCKECSINFVEGDKRCKQTTAVKKALAVMLYSLGKGSFNMIGKILGHSPSIIYRWIRKEMQITTEPVVTSDIKEMEFDEMWHFVGSKKTRDGLSKQWIVLEGELLPGLLALVMLRRSEGYMKK